MKTQKSMLLVAFSLLLILATAIGCGTLGENFLIPIGGSASFQFFAPKFAFLFNADQTNTISSYTVNPTNGALTLAASGVPTNVSGCCQEFMDVDPTSRFLFVPNGGNNSVSTFTINPDGTLTGPVGTDAAAGNFTWSVKLHPSGKFLYASNIGDGTISVFSVGTNGALTPVGTAVSAGTNAHSLIMDWQGRFLYVTHESASCCWGGTPNNTVNGFSIDSQTGALTSLGTFNTGITPRGGMVDYSGQYLIVADRGNENSNSAPTPADPGSIAVFSIASNGSLTPVPGSPFTDPGCTNVDGCGPFNVAEAIVNGTAYIGVPNLNDASISVFTLDTTSGKLTPVSGSPFNLGGVFSWPHWGVVDTSGQFGYVVDPENGIIVQVALSSTGAASQVGSSITDGLSSWSTQLIFSH